MFSLTLKASPLTRRRPQPTSTRSRNCSTCSSTCRPSAASQDLRGSFPNAFRAIVAMTPNRSGSYCAGWESHPYWPDETPNTAADSESVAGSSNEQSPGYTHLADSDADWIDSTKSKKHSFDSAARWYAWASWLHKVHLFRTLLGGNNLGS